MTSDDFKYKLYSRIKLLKNYPEKTVESLRICEYIKALHDAEVIDSETSYSIMCNLFHTMIDSDRSENND